MLIKCVVACHNASGSPDFYFCIVNCTEPEYELGVHYDIAESSANEQGYDGPFVVFDEKECPDWLLERFVWASASTVTRQTVLPQILRDVTNSFKTTPYEINNGLCESWAIDVQAALKTTRHRVGIWETVFALADTTHVFLQIDGKFYDAECLDGVDSYMQLPIFSKLRPQPVVLIDADYEAAITRYQVTLEQLKECGYNMGSSKVFE